MNKLIIYPATDENKRYRAMAHALGGRLEGFTRIGAGITATEGWLWRIDGNVSTIEFTSSERAFNDLVRHITERGKP